MATMCFFVSLIPLKVSIRTWWIEIWTYRFGSIQHREDVGFSGTKKFCDTLRHNTAAGGSDIKFNLIAMVLSKLDVARQQLAALSSVMQAIAVAEKLRSYARIAGLKQSASFTQSKMRGVVTIMCLS